MWPLAPTFMRRPRHVTTTHDPQQGGRPRLVMASAQHPRPDDRPPAFGLEREVTTIGSAPDSDICLPGLDARHAEVRHDEMDEYVIVRLGAGGPPGSTAPRSTGHCSAPEPACASATGELSYYREEYADHGRPYGGRIGGELGHQKPQPPQMPRQVSR